MRLGSVLLSYDPELRLTRAASGAGGGQERMAIDYDPQGRIAQMSWPLDADRRVEHDFAYDRNGNLARFRDGEGHATTFAYDEADRRIAEEAPGHLPPPASPRPAS